MCLVCLLGFGGGERDAATAPFPALAEPFPLEGAQALGLHVTWTGVAGFVLERAGTRIAFDPFASRPGLLATLLRRPRSDDAAVARHFGGLAAAFVGHAHHDHAMDLPALAAASPEARIVGGPTVVELCRRQGVAGARLETARDGARFQVGPFTVEAVGAEHGVVPLVRFVDRATLSEHGLPCTPFRYPRGEVFAWRVEVLGRSVFLQGSAGLKDGSLLRQPPADVLVACLAARAGTPRYLERLGERLRPRVLVPCHHDDFFRPLSELPRPIATLRWSAFLDEAARLGQAYGTKLWRPVRLATASW